jgi:hypothetical protein
MAFGIAEDPALSPSTHLDAVDSFPVWREQLVKLAADNGASVDVINLFKCLPRAQYASKDEVVRDFAEAARRFAMGNPHSDDDDEAIRDRRNLGRDAVEGAPGGMTRHP